MHFIIEGKRWSFWLHPDFQIFASASRRSFFSMMYTTTQASKKLQKIHSLPRILSLARYTFLQIHALMYFRMAGLGSNLDQLNLNWKNTARFILELWYKVISFSKFGWSWFFFPKVVRLFCLSFQKYKSISKEINQPDKQKLKKKQ